MTPTSKVKLRIEFTEEMLKYVVSLPITRQQRVDAANHLRHIANDLERPWRGRRAIASAIAKSRTSQT